MTEAEKRRRFQRYLGWVYLPMIAGPSLILKAYKLRDGVISVADFLWYAALVVPLLFVAALAPWLEDRRLRRLAEERRQTRRSPLSLDV